MINCCDSKRTLIFDQNRLFELLCFITADPDDSIVAQTRSCLKLRLLFYLAAWSVQDLNLFDRGLELRLHTSLV